MPSYVGKTGLSTGIGTGSINFTAAGSLQADDALLVFIENANQAIPSGGFLGTGFEPAASFGSGTAGAAGATRIELFWKQRATGSETTLTIPDSGDHTVALGIVLRPDAGKIVNLDTYMGNNLTVVDASNTISMEDVTTTVANSLIVHAVGSDRDFGSTTNFTTVTNGNLTSLTERHDQTVSSGQGGGLGIWTGVKATAGAIGATTIVNNAGATVNFATMTLAFSDLSLSSRSGFFHLLMDA